MGASLSTQDLELIRNLCDRSLKAEMNWPLAVSLFPAQTPQEELWKNRMLLGILLVCGDVPGKTAAFRPPPRFLGFLHEEVYNRCKEYLALCNRPGREQKSADLKATIVRLYKLIRKITAKPLDL